jgi:hypothetical protein
VERTIEKVVTPPASGNSAAVATTRETVVVKEDDKIIESIDKNKNSANDQLTRNIVNTNTAAANIDSSTFYLFPL